MMETGGKAWTYFCLLLKKLTVKVSNQQKKLAELARKAPAPSASGKCSDRYFEPQLIKNNARDGIERGIVINLKNVWVNNR
jgi:hypothetical protein